MWNAGRVRLNQGWQFIGDLRRAVPIGLRGRPEIAETACADGCSACASACPTDAIVLDPVRIDLGRCVFCNECAVACPTQRIAFTAEPRMGAATRADLIVHPGKAPPDPVAISQALRAMFGRSLKLRQVSAGGCNACEMEMNALSNVNFDLQRFGIEWVASPRHADALVVTGPITRNMAEALQLAWDAMPAPRFVVGVGACAISGGLYADSPALDRGFLERCQPALLVPGCPPHPLTFILAILDLLGIDTGG
jgi:Ni,Fe-hydrogenase III small subunit/NAD-dependent dihydropyrimidine dehydrogenase PreA subunit